MAESQQTTIINLHNSGVPPETIAQQLDISLEEVSRAIAGVEVKSALIASPSLASYYLDAVVDLDKAI
jgi:transcriptional antiterminator